MRACSSSSAARTPGVRSSADCALIVSSHHCVAPLAARAPRADAGPIERPDSGLKARIVAAVGAVVVAALSELAVGPGQTFSGLLKKEIVPCNHGRIVPRGAFSRQRSRWVATRA